MVLPPPLLEKIRTRASAATKLGDAIEALQVEIDEREQKKSALVTAEQQSSPAARSGLENKRMAISFEIEKREGKRNSLRVDLSEMLRPAHGELLEIVELGGGQGSPSISAAVPYLDSEGNCCQTRARKFIDAVTPFLAAPL